MENPQCSYHIKASKGLANDTNKRIKNLRNLSHASNSRMHISTSLFDISSFASNQAEIEPEWKNSINDFPLNNISIHNDQHCSIENHADIITTQKSINNNR